MENWCLEYGIDINKDKSAIMNINVDKRTPLPNYKKDRDIPIVQEYKCLGVIIDLRVIIDDSVMFRPMKIKLLT